MSATLPLDVETWDLVLDKNGDWTARKDEAFVASQSVANSCMMFTDDAYFFPEEGIPYKWDILGERAAQPLLEAYLKREAMAVENVIKCKIVDYRFENRTIHGVMIIWTKNGGQYDVSF